MQAGLGLSRSDTITYAKSVVDVIVQLGRQGSERGIVAIEQLSEPPAFPEAEVRRALSRARAA
jgi:hypothetical protein